MSAPRKCAKCGAVLNAESALDVCPRCVAAQVLGPADALEIESAALAPVTEQPGDRIGRYKLREKIGEGGCGVVYVAEQEEPVRRRVALKVIKLGMDTRDVIARFEAERQALAMMDHTNIAKVLDAGTTETGRPFFVMELVRGIRITDYCDENKLNTERRLDLFIQVCRAVQHAHQKGIIHRDLKPSNILVTINDGVPVPKVIDFGIAKATEGRLTDKTIYTQLHQFIGTPAYMSPEQAMMTSLDIDTRSDIYSLGVLLYELLTGRPPFDPRAMMAAGLVELRRTIREQEPPRPSTRLSTLPQDDLTTAARRRSTEPPRLIHSISGDLDWIVMKCLEKDRTRRYETANGLAADLKRHLNNEPISARPPSTVYTFKKFVGRNKVVFAAASAVAAAVLIGLGVSTALFLKERQSRQRAVVAEQASTAETQRATASAEETRQRLLRLRLDNGARLLGAGDLMKSLPWFLEAFKVDQGHPEHEAKHRLRLASILQQSPRPRQMWFHGGSANCALSPDGKLALTGASDGTSALWDVETGRQLAIAQFPPGTSSWPRCRFSADGKSALAEGESAVVIWDLRATPRARIISVNEQIHTSAISSDGRFYMMRTARRPLLIWNAATGNLTEVSSTFSDKIDAMIFLPPEARSVFRLEVSAATPVFLTADRAGNVRAWDGATMNMLYQQKIAENLAPSLFKKAEFSPDGRFLVLAQSAYRDFNMLLWDVVSGRLIAELKHDHHVYDIAFSADSKTVVTCGQDRSARIWDAQTGKRRGAPLQHERLVHSVSISPGGQLIVTASEDGTARIWDLHTGKPVGPPLVHSASVKHAVFGADDATVATGCDDGTVRVWDIAASPKWQWAGPQAVTKLGLSIREIGFNDPNWGAVLVQPDGLLVLGLQEEQPRFVRVPVGGIGFAAASRDGKRVLIGRQVNRDFKYQLWATETSQPLGPAFSTEIQREYLFQRSTSADCSRLVTLGQNKEAQIWDTLTGKSVGPRIQLPEAKDEFDVELSPDGTAVTAIVKGRLHLWDVATGRERFAALENMSSTKRISFSADSLRFVAACKDRSGARFAQVWDARNGEPIGQRLPHQAPILSVELSQDGRRVVTASDDHRAQVWDVQTGALGAPIMESPHALEMAAFGLDDRAVVGACEDGTVPIWDSRSGEPLIPPLQHGSWIKVGVRYQRAMLLAGGRTLFTFMVESRLWEMPADNRSVEEWEQTAQLLSAQRFNAKGELEPLGRTSLSNLWFALRSRSPAEFSASSARRYHWHIWRAETSVAEWNADSALPHLNALVAMEPERLRFRWQRSRVCEALRRWDVMAEDLRAAVKLDPNERLYKMHRVAAELAAGNQPEYQAAGAAFAESLRPDDSLDTVSEAISFCCVATNLPPPTLSLLRARLQPFEKGNQSGKRYNRALGRLNFREGRFEEALTALKTVNREEMAESDRIFRAMSHRALGQTEEADFWLARAHAHLDPIPSGSKFSAFGSDLPAIDRLLSILLAEADAMVK